jgi:FMN reductase
MSHRALLIAGSPTASSRSTAVLNAFAKELERRSWQTETYGLDSFPAEALLRGRFDAEPVQRFIGSVRSASALVFSTPVYKATYAGSLKTIIDLIEPMALEGKALLGIATARLEPHLAEVDLGFQRLYAFFKGSRGLATLGLLDPQVGAAAAISLDAAAQKAFDAALDRLQGAVG